MSHYNENTVIRQIDFFAACSSACLFDKDSSFI